MFSSSAQSRNVFQPGMFKDKVLFCTAGRSGICREIVRKMLSLGCRATIVSRSGDKTAQAAQELEKETGQRCLGLQADVRDSKALEEAVRRTVEEFGGIDFVVCGAAGNFLAPIEGLSSNALKTVIDIDLMGTFNTMKATLPEVKKSRGSYISISATLHYQGMPYQAHVSSAKAAVDALSNVLAVEVGPFGVRSNVIAPGPIANTVGMSRLGLGKTMDEGEIPLGRMGGAEDIAGMSVFLFSEEAKWITGGVFVVDGGHRHTQTGLVPYPQGVLEPRKFMDPSRGGEKAKL